MKRQYTRLNRASSAKNGAPVPCAPTTARNEKRRAHRAANLEQYRAKEKAYTDANKDRRNANAQAWKKANPDKIKWYMRLFKFGITEVEFDAQLAWQDDRCAICATDWPGPKDWCVDHDHATGHLRGILCHACNKGLGHFRDNPKILERAIRYLKDYGREY